MDRLWYYVQFGNQHGPVSETELKQLLGRGELRPDDLVWKDGMPEWAPAERVNELFPTAARKPPPLPASSLQWAAFSQTLAGQIQEPRDLPAPNDDEAEDGRPRPNGYRTTNDLWAWLLAAVPIMGVTIELIQGRTLTGLYLMLNMVCGLADVGALRADNRPAPSRWWAVLLTPVYLWKRGTVLRSPRVHFGLWFFFVFCVAGYES